MLALLEIAAAPAQVSPSQQHPSSTEIPTIEVLPNYKQYAVLNYQNYQENFYKHAVALLSQGAGCS